MMLPLILPPCVPVNVFGVYGLLDGRGRRWFWFSMVVGELVLLGVIACL